MPGASWAVRVSAGGEGPQSEETGRENGLPVWVGGCGAMCSDEHTAKCCERALGSHRHEVLPVGLRGDMFSLGMILGRAGSRSCVPDKHPGLRQ